MVKNKKEEKKDLKEDIYGVILIVIGVFVLLSLVSDKTGIIGKYLILGLSMTLGVGKYFVPFGLLLWGLAFLAHKEVKIKSTGLGLFILVVSFTSAIHASVPLKSMFQEGNIASRGGLIGAIVSYPLVLLIKPLGTYIVLGGSMVIGMILTTGKTLMEIKDLFKDRLFSNEDKKDRKIYTRDKKKETKDKEEEIFEKPNIKLVTPPEFKVEVDTSPKDNVIKLRKDGKYNLPPLRLLKKSKSQKKKTVKEMKQILEKTFREFKVAAKVIDIKEGPTVTRFEIQLEPGVKVNKILNIEDDISLAFASPDVRIISPIPGKAAVGIEVPNIYRELVTLGDILSNPLELKQVTALTIAIGKDITGSPIFADLREMPHLLIAGATGSGKSICLNSILVSILFHAQPDEVKMILIDPKRIELNIFNDIPHLIIPVVTSPKKAASALSWAVNEMERRFDVLSQIGARNLEAYNNKAVQKGLDKMPFILIVIDELADLMMVAANEVENAICRLAQLARAVGIHLVVATQRPSTDIITGLIKSNITTRIAFAVSSQIDSRVILDTPGAEKLVSKGDMLFSTPSFSKPMRIQGSFVTESEIEKVIDFTKEQVKPEYKPEILETSTSKFGHTDFDDDFFEEAVEMVLRYKSASVSFLQRKLRIGYSRAARIMDIMEDRGIITPLEGSKSREVLITEEDWENIKHKAKIDKQV